MQRVINWTPIEYAVLKEIQPYLVKYEKSCEACYRVCYILNGIWWCISGKFKYKITDVALINEP